MPFLQRADSSLANELRQHVEVSDAAIQWLKQEVESGNLGMKSGKGIYEYKKGKQIKDSFALNKDLENDIVNKLLYVMYDEAVGCLQRGVVETTDDIDLGMIYGTGFAPFRGGLMTHFSENYNTEITTIGNEKG